MKKLITICVVAGMILAVSGVAQATAYYGVFDDPDDSWFGNNGGLIDGPTANGTWTSGELAGHDDWISLNRHTEYGLMYAQYIFAMGNEEKPEPWYKEMHFEATWLQTDQWFDDNTRRISLFKDGNYDWDTPNADVTWLDVDNDGHSDGVTVDWIISPGCPAWEQLNLYEDTTSGNPHADPAQIWYIEHARMESNCIPEPATIALLGIGGLLLRKRKA